jgi:hypothetical protein
LKSLPIVSEQWLVGSNCRWELAFVEKVKNDLGLKAIHRQVLETDGGYALREPSDAYAGNFTGEIEALQQ